MTPKEKIDYMIQSLQLFKKEIDENNEWISVKDRLPSTDNDVLVTYWEKDNHNFRNIAITSYGEMCFGGHSLGHKDWVSPFTYFKRYYEIIAWKPLPDVYDGDLKIGKFKA